MRLIKRTLIALSLVLVAGFLAFLYFIPPFFVAPPETFSKGLASAPPGVGDIKDLAERAIAERGRYIVMTAGCIGCHGTPTSQGPDLDRYLAGGARFVSRSGTFVSRNLTPDQETGLARRTDTEVKRILASGVFPDGRVTSHVTMPWANFSNWTDEDRHAVLVYLRHLKPIRHRIPEPSGPAPLGAPGVLEEVYAGQDYGEQLK